MRVARSVYAALWVCTTILVGAVPVDGAEKLRLPGIKGTDERIMIDSAAYPWRAVGRVNRRIGGVRSV